MKFVLDASIGLKTVLPEVDSDKAIDLFMDYLNFVHELIAPDTYLVECGHGLTRAERMKIIQPPQGQEKFTLISAAAPELYSHLPLLNRAFEISSATLHGLYDCLYLALSEAEGCPVVTTDDKLLKKFPADTISLSSL